MILARRGIPSEALEQRRRQHLRDFELRDHGGKRAIGRIVDRLTTIGEIEATLQAGKRLQRLGAAVDRIVGFATEGVERQRRTADATRQQQ